MRVEGMLEVMVRERDDGTSLVSAFASRIIDRSARWTRRYCTLSSQGMCLYKPLKLPSAGERPERTVSFADGWALQCNPQTPDGRPAQLTFRLQSPTSTTDYLFVCGDHESLQSWITGWASGSQRAGAVSHSPHRAIAATAAALGSNHGEARASPLSSAVPPRTHSRSRAVGLASEHGGVAAGSAAAPLSGRSIFRAAGSAASALSPAAAASIFGNVLGRVAGTVEGYMSEMKEALSMNLDSDSDSGLDSDQEKKADALAAERERDKMLLRLIESEDMQLLQKVGTKDVSAQQRAAAAARRAREADLKAKQSLGQGVSSHSMASVRGAAQNDERFNRSHVEQRFEDALSGEDENSSSQGRPHKTRLSLSEEDYNKDDFEEASNRSSAFKWSPSETPGDGMSERGSTIDDRGSYWGEDYASNDPRSDVGHQKREVHEKMQRVLATVEDRCKRCRLRVNGMRSAASKLEARESHAIATMERVRVRGEAANQRSSLLAVAMDIDQGVDQWGKADKALEFLTRDSRIVQQEIRQVQEESDSILARIKSARETRISLLASLALRQPPRTITMIVKDALYIIVLFLLRSCLWVLVPPLLLVRKGMLVVGRFFTPFYSKKQGGARSHDATSFSSSSAKASSSFGFAVNSPGAGSTIEAAPPTMSTAKDMHARRKLELMKSERAGGRGMAGRARKASKDESQGVQERGGGQVPASRGSPSALNLTSSGGELPLGKGRIRSLYETSVQVPGDGDSASNRRSNLPDSGDLILPQEAGSPKEFQIRTTLNRSREDDDGFLSE